MAEATDKRISCTVEAFSAAGYRVTFDLMLTMQDLSTALERLGAAGYTPQPARTATAPQAAPSASQARLNGSGRKQEAPYYDDDGAACCPIHERPLKEGKYGWFCSQKAEGPGSKNGYCSFTAKD